MAATNFQYCILKFNPDPLRGEAVNIGIVVFLKEKLDIHLNSSQQKMRALVAGVSDDLLPGAVNTIREWTAGIESTEGRYLALRGLQFFDCSPMGEFFASDQNTYKKKISQLTHQWVSPSGQIAEKVKRSGNWLHNNLRRKFEEIKVLSNDHTDIDYGMVLPYYPIDAHSRIFSDFGFKTIRTHIICTLDLDAEIDNLKRTAAYKAFICERAKALLGDDTQIALAYNCKEKSESSDMILNYFQPKVSDLIDISSKQEFGNLINFVSANATPNMQLPLH